MLYWVIAFRIEAFVDDEVEARCARSRRRMRLGAKSAQQRFSDATVPSVEIAPEEAAGSVASASIRIFRRGRHASMRREKSVGIVTMKRNFVPASIIRLGGRQRGRHRMERTDNTRSFSSAVTIGSCM